MVKLMDRRFRHFDQVFEQWTFLDRLVLEIFNYGGIKIKYYTIGEKIYCPTFHIFISIHIVMCRFCGGWLLSPAVLESTVDT